MSHENPYVQPPLDPEATQPISAAVLAELRAQGTEQPTELYTPDADALHETGSSKAVTQQEEPAWAGTTGFDAFSAPIEVVRSQVERDFPGFAGNTIPQDPQHWSLRGMQTTSAYRQQRSPEVAASVTPSAMGDEIARQQGMGTVEESFASLRADIASLANFDFHAVQVPPAEAYLAPQPDAAFGEQISAPEYLDELPEATSEEPALVEEAVAAETAAEDGEATVQIPWQAPVHKSSAVVPLYEAFGPPTENPNAGIERLAEQSLQFEVPADLTSSENLEPVERPEIPAFSNTGPSMQEVFGNQQPVAEPSAQQEAIVAAPAYDSLYAAQEKLELQAAPAAEQPAQPSAAAPEQPTTVKITNESVANTVESHLHGHVVEPLDLSVRGVSEFLGRHKKATRIAEIAGAAALAAVAGAKLLGRLRRRR